MPSIKKRAWWDYADMSSEQRKMWRRSFCKYFVGVCFPLFIILFTVLLPSIIWRNLGILVLVFVWVSWAGFRIWDYILFRPIWDIEVPTVAELKEANEEETEPNKRPFFGFIKEKSKITHSIKIIKGKT